MAKRIISTATLVIAQLLDQLNTLELLKVKKWVEDPNLAFDSSIRKLAMSKKLYNEVSNANNLPLIAYSRTLLEDTGILPNDGFMRVYNEESTQDPETQENVIVQKMYNASHAKFKFSFAFYSNDMVDVDRFEVFQLNDFGFSSIKSINLDLGSTINQVLEYEVRWEPLQNLVMEWQEHAYNMISGSCDISGFFMALDDVEGTLIKEIELIFSTLKGEALNTNIIL